SRHTRSNRAWSSDVCSSDLSACVPLLFLFPDGRPIWRPCGGPFRAISHTPLVGASALGGPAYSPAPNPSRQGLICLNVRILKGKSGSAAAKGTAERLKDVEL